MPKPLRDWAYSEFARQRFALFGKRDTCMVPTPELLARFML
jgi:predicted DCC family thiol-disulfide oxidoreductase YuxK